MAGCCNVEDMDTRCVALWSSRTLETRPFDMIGDVKVMISDLMASEIRMHLDRLAAGTWRPWTIGVGLIPIP